MSSPKKPGLVAKRTVPLEGGTIVIKETPLRGKAAIEVEYRGRQISMLASALQLDELVEALIARRHALKLSLAAAGTAPALQPSAAAPPTDVAAD